MTMDNEFHRGGSARWLNEQDFRDADMFRQGDDAIYLGQYDGRNLFFNDAPCGLICAGSRSNKGAGIIVPNLINNYSKRTKIIYSWKPDLAMISRDQTFAGRKCLYIAPTPAFDLPQHRVNPLGHIHINSPTLEGDIKVKCESFLPESNGGNSKYFELTGQRFTGAIDLALVERDGVLTFPAIYDAINRIQQDDDAWEEIAFFMRNSRFPSARTVEAEIKHGKESGSNAFYGVVSEVVNAFDSCLSDSNLMTSVSPPFDTTWEEVILDGNYNVYFLYDARFAKTWGRIARTNLSAIKTIKERLPEANGIDIWADESPKLAPLPEADELVSFSPGLGIRTIWIFQTIKQMTKIIPNGDSILPAGCGFQLYFGQREPENAKRISEIIGEESLYFDDELKRDEAEHRARQAVHEMMQGGDPMITGMEFDHYSKMANHRSQMSRFLQKPDEVMRLPKGKAYLKLDSGTGLIDIPPYFMRRDQAGKYLPDPYHSCLDRVKVKTLFGYKWLPVKRGAPPPEYADYPQFQGHDHVYVGKK